MSRKIVVSARKSKIDYCLWAHRPIVRRHTPSSTAAPPRPVALRPRRLPFRSTSLRLVSRNQFRSLNRMKFISIWALREKCSRTETKKLRATSCSRTARLSSQRSETLTDARGFPLSLSLPLSLPLSFSLSFIIFFSTSWKSATGNNRVSSLLPNYFSET